MKNETVKPVVEEAMKKFTPDLIATAKTAKSAGELWELAKANNVELTEEEAKSYFEQLNANGIVSDNELDIVAGGCGDDEEEKEVNITATNSVKCPFCGCRIPRSTVQFYSCQKCGKIVGPFV